MAKFSKYVGVDVHKEKVNVAVAAVGREEPRDWGEIDNRPEALRKLLGRPVTIAPRSRRSPTAKPLRSSLPVSSQIARTG